LPYSSLLGPANGRLIPQNPCRLSDYGPCPL
jgi:hypothetical protein